MLVEKEKFLKDKLRKVLFLNHTQYESIIIEIKEANTDAHAEPAIPKFNS